MSLDRLADGSYSIDADPECFMVIINFLQVGLSLENSSSVAFCSMIIDPVCCWFLAKSSQFSYILQYDRVILPSLGGPTIEDIGFVANQLALGSEISLQVGDRNFYQKLRTMQYSIFLVKTSWGASRWREITTLDTSKATGLIEMCCWIFSNKLSHI